MSDQHDDPAAWQRDFYPPIERHKGDGYDDQMGTIHETDPGSPRRAYATVKGPITLASLAGLVNGMKKAGVDPQAELVLAVVPDVGGYALMELNIR